MLKDREIVRTLKRLARRIMAAIRGETAPRWPRIEKRYGPLNDPIDAEWLKAFGFYGLDDERDDVLSRELRPGGFAGVRIVMEAGKIVTDDYGPAVWLIRLAIWRNLASELEPFYERGATIIDHACFNRGEALPLFLAWGLFGGHTMPALVNFGGLDKHSNRNAPG